MATWRPFRLGSALALLMAGLLLAVACAPVLEEELPPTAAPVAVPITLIADGQTRALLTTAATVDGVLAEAGLAVAPADEVTPPLIAPMTAAGGAPLVITCLLYTSRCV